ncbi:MAG: hypothetical protein P9M05_02340 [Candidatus Stygibacter australis]|nr:hypothetical protein [Candidatus Stygibacter australis]
MDNIEILEVSCPCVDGSELPFYGKRAGFVSLNLTSIIHFISGLDLSESGKIDIGRNAKGLILDLLATDDFGAPPVLLFIKFSTDDTDYDISIPFSNSTYLNLNIYKTK